MARHGKYNLKKKADLQKKIQGQPMNLSPVRTKIQNKQQYEVQEGKQTYAQNIKMKIIINGVQGQPISIQPTFNSNFGGNQNVMKNLNQVQRKSPARPYQTTTTTSTAKPDQLWQRMKYKFKRMKISKSKKPIYQFSAQITTWRSSQRLQNSIGTAPRIFRRQMPMRNSSGSKKQHMNWASSLLLQVACQ
ncbi:hypothetical protein OXYTRIMIC_402 [Oxytricha trifallax]|uniref:Uncharacterized protein n=1 Tax=Oxytricha trifallax TaxID=1172189 RepID=A0A073HYI7_9SPIT|nr:hypothetical protein OXYTRIMIC_402 [Oxytricha trifallax]